MFWNEFPYTDFHELNLDWILKLMKELGLDVQGLKEQLDNFSDDIQAQVDYLTAWVNNYSDSWAKGVIQKYLATMIFVEISDAGYVVYYVPDDWEEITFNTTDLDIDVPDVDYGHLVLSY